MHKSKKFGFSVKSLALHIALLIVIKSTDCRRLSFKDSLTAYAENESSVSSSTETSFRKETRIQVNLDPVKESLPQTSLQVERKRNADGAKHSKLTPFTGHVSNFTSILSKQNFNKNAANQFSLWNFTKPFLFPLQNAWNTKSLEPDHITSESLLRPVYSAKASIENETTSPSNTALFKNSTNMGASKTLRKDGNLQGPDQQRNKKEIGNNPGLRELVWNTATALWSVNREHFLPTFLHTKTGGKLSLIRDSVFKPVTILSQFKSGVKEINNEKIRNLARLSTGGHGWSRPQVLVSYPRQTRLQTLATYFFRLTKHTVVTKWRLKRAIIDLQLRAYKKLIRILTSKTLAQKLAIIRILTGAALKGKTAVLRFLVAARPTTTTTPSSVSHYPGVDNSANVDITYSSLNKYNSQAWMTNLTPTQDAPPPSSMPLSSYYSAPPNKPVQSAPPQPMYSAPPNSMQSAPPKPMAMYGAPPNPMQSAPPKPMAMYGAPPNPMQSVPPKPMYGAPPNPMQSAPPKPMYGPPPKPMYGPPPKPIIYNNNGPQNPSHNAPPNNDFSMPPVFALPPMSSTYSMSPGTSSSNSLPPVPHTMFMPPSPLQSSVMRSTYYTIPTSPDPLIEQPSYAQVLKTMGINPTNYDFQDNTQSSTPSTAMGKEPTNYGYQKHIESSPMNTTMGNSNNNEDNTISSPTPTVVYFSSLETSHNQESVTDDSNVPTVEKPTLSYAYHSSSNESPSSDDNKITTSYVARTTPATSFGMKLLEAMYGSR